MELTMEKYEELNFAKYEAEYNFNEYSNCLKDKMENLFNLFIKNKLYVYCNQDNLYNIKYLDIDNVYFSFVLTDNKKIKIQTIDLYYSIPIEKYKFEINLYDILKDNYLEFFKNIIMKG